jgi:hypothetical protein
VSDSNPIVEVDYWNLIEPYWLALNESWDSPIVSFPAALHEVPLKVQDLYCCHWCQSEVDNGGFDQFFSNSTGLLAPEALAGFRRIGLRDWSSIIEEAMLYFGSPYPRQRSARLERLLAEPERGTRGWSPFGALDHRFNSCPDGDRNSWQRSANRYAASA